jgi:hypothetical protein
MYRSCFPPPPSSSLSSSSSSEDLAVAGALSLFEEEVCAPIRCQGGIVRVSEEPLPCTQNT